MLDNFWATLGSDLAGSLMNYLFGPAFLFWAGGLALYVLQHGWHSILTSIQGWDLVQQGTSLVAALFVVILSSLAMKAVHFHILRLLEGYWPWPLNFLGRSIVTMRKKGFIQHNDRLHVLKGKKEPLTTEEQDELASLEIWAHRYPVSAYDLLPTGLGNLLRARERASERIYGLDAVVCWPRLWSLLPSSEQEDLASARDALNSQAELWLWGVLFLLWAIITPWAVLIALGWMILAYSMTVQTAAAYGDLLEAAFDLHRLDLYDALTWPRPKDSNGEKATGARLSEFLWRGTLDENVTYPTTKTTKS